MKNLSAAQLREKLSGYDRAGLERFIGEIYRNCTAARDYLNIELGGAEYEQALLENAKQQVRECFFTRGGRGKLETKKAREITHSFEDVCKNPDSVLELRMCFVRNMSEIARNYSNLPSAFYRDAESMLRSAVTLVNKQQDIHLQEKARKEMQDILQNVQYSEGGLYESFRNITQSLYVQENNKTPNQEDKDQTAKHTEFPWSVSSKKIGGKTLSEEDREFFFSLLYSLANSVNHKLKIHENISFEYGKYIEDISFLQNILTRIWKDTALIDTYLQENANKHSEEECRIIAGWKMAIHDRFVLERHLKNGSVFISYQTEKVYLVKGLQSSWDDLFAFHPMPLMLEATLLPFKDVIVTDGVFIPYRIHFGTGIANKYKEIYMTAKRKGEIMDEL